MNTRVERTHSEDTPAHPTAQSLAARSGKGTVHCILLEGRASRRKVSPGGGRSKTKAIPYIPTLLYSTGNGVCRIVSAIPIRDAENAECARGRAAHAGRRRSPARPPSGRSGTFFDGPGVRIFRSTRPSPRDR